MFYGVIFVEFFQFMECALGHFLNFSGCEHFVAVFIKDLNEA